VERDDEQHGHAPDPVEGGHVTEASARRPAAALPRTLHDDGIPHPAAVEEPVGLRGLGFAPLTEADLERSALAGRLVLLLGPVDATTEVGRALAASGDVRFADVPTDLFTRGLARIAGSYAASLLPGPGQGTGLVALFDPPELLRRLRALADDLLDEVRAGAATLVDHGPGLAASLDLIELLYPDARLVHVDAAGVVAQALRARRPRLALALAAEAGRTRSALGGRGVAVEPVRPTGGRPPWPWRALARPVLLAGRWRAGGRR
jgi:hypothetical protein